MEAQTLHCQSCGASVGEGDLRCPYCHSQLATVACPACFSLVPVSARHCPKCGAAIQPAPMAKSPLDCPECRSPLASTTLGGLPLDQCLSCGGLWVDQATFGKMAADREERGQVMGSFPVPPPNSPLPLKAVRYHPCPRCAKLMNRQNFAHLSGVVLDVCKEHGLWFERDELRRVLAFIESGGLERSRDHEREALKAERQVASEAVPLQGGAWTEPLSDREPGSLSLKGVLESLVSLFFKE